MKPTTLTPEKAQQFMNLFKSVNTAIKALDELETIYISELSDEVKSEAVINNATYDPFDELESDLNHKYLNAIISHPELATEDIGFIREKCLQLSKIRSSLKDQFEIELCATQSGEIIRFVNHNDC